MRDDVLGSRRTRRVSGRGEQRRLPLECPSPTARGKERSRARTVSPQAPPRGACPGRVGHPTPSRAQVTRGDHTRGAGRVRCHDTSRSLHIQTPRQPAIQPSICCLSPPCERHGLVSRLSLPTWRAALSAMDRDLTRPCAALTRPTRWQSACCLGLGRSGPSCRY